MSPIAIGRLNFCFWLLMIIFIILALKMAHITLSKGYQDRANIIVMGRSAHSLRILQERLTVIENMTNNIDDYSLNRVKKIVSDTAQSIDWALLELNSQNMAWTKIQSRMNAEKDSFFEIQEQLDQIREIQGDEILRLKRIMDSADQPPFYKAFLQDMKGFIFGLLSSLFASFVWAIIRDYKNRKKTHM